MTDTTHLVALTTRLYNERRALAAATKTQEIELRKVWVAQIEREINGEERFLGMTVTDWTAPEVSDDELMAELMA
jgi:spore coat protein CotF